MNEKSDLELLHEFAQERGESAFAELVRRYVNLVYSAALRLVNDPHLAHDVSQSVFIALAQSAEVLVPKARSGMPLSAWLHLTTRNLAAKTIRGEARRRGREQAAGMPAPDAETPDARWDQIAPHLDESMAELAEPDRHAILLRFFEGKTAREIGHRLQTSEEAAQKRVARALERLRIRLAARGVFSSATALAAGIAGNAVQGAPVALAASIASTAAAAGLAPIALSAPTASFFSIIAMTKAQTGILVGIGSALAIPLIVQYAAFTGLRAELAAPPSAATESAPQVAAGSRRESYASELARLHEEREALRIQLAAKSAKNLSPTLSRPAGPTLLAVGRNVAMADLVFAGNSTPEAALQSFLALQREGDFEGLLNLTLDVPRDEERMMLATPEGREQAGRVLKAQVQSLLSIELLGARAISERRVEMVLRETKANGVSTNSINFGHGATGWKMIL